MEVEDGGQYWSRSWKDGMNLESSSTSNSGYRSSSAPANLYNDDNKFSRPHSETSYLSRSSYSLISWDPTSSSHERHLSGFRGSSRSSSRRSSVSWNSDLDRDGGTMSEYTSYPSHCPETYRQRRRSIHQDMHKLGPDRFRSKVGLSRSRSLHNSHIERRQGPPPEDWGNDRSPGNIRRPHNYRRLSLSPPCVEDRTHHPAPDHRRLFHRHFVGGYGGHSPTARPQIFNPKRFRRVIPSGPNPLMNYTACADPSFRPCKGDVIIVQPNQRGRMPNPYQPRQHQGCVKSYSGSDEDFVFRNGDLIARIGSYCSKQFAGTFYVPYKILELYGRHDGVWKFVGDAHTEEDLGENRKSSCIEIQHSGAIGVGENCPIEPNYGDFVIYHDRIKYGGEELTSRSSVIDWWTPYLLQKLNMVYPQNMILLRPYVRNHDFLHAPESWLGRRVTRVNRARQGKVEEGIVVKIWPESLVQDGPPSTLEALEVLGPDRVGVRVRNWRKGTVPWHLSETFLECDDQPLSNYQSAKEQERFKAAPWGSIEMYIYSKKPPAGWIYWGSSQHTL